MPHASCPNPKFQTPFPKPQTPNPKPQTPNPKRDNRERHVGLLLGGRVRPSRRVRGPKPEPHNPKPETRNPMDNANPARIWLGGLIKFTMPGASVVRLLVRVGRGSPYLPPSRGCAYRGGEQRDDGDHRARGPPIARRGHPFRRIGHGDNPTFSLHLYYSQA